MVHIGFRCFTSPPAPEVLSMRQQVVNLTDEQRGKLLEAFTNKIPAEHIYYTLGLSIELINYVYEGIDAIEEASRLLMRGEYIITPAVTHIDPTTLEVVVDTPAVYAPVPTTQTLLRQAIAPLFSADYPVLFCSNAVNEMIKQSKYDGRGLFSFYQAQIIL